MFFDRLVYACGRQVMKLLGNVTSNYDIRVENASDVPKTGYISYNSNIYKIYFQFFKCHKQSVILAS